MPAGGGRGRPMISRSSRGGTDSGPRKRPMTQPSFATHEVFNQSPPFEDVDLFAVDRPLVEAVKANGGAAASASCRSSASIGARPRWPIAGASPTRTRRSCAASMPRAIAATRSSFIPAYHELMAHSAHAGVHNSTWTAEGKPAGGAAEVIRAAKFYIASQVETGHLCPITMTRASVARAGDAAGPARAAMPVLGDDALRSELRAVVGEARHDARHGHDREAGRHRRARQHDARRARRRGLPHHRAQMVHVGADVRRVPGAGAGGGGPDLFLHAALCAGRHRSTRSSSSA